MFIFNMGGLRVLHMGDFGQSRLTEEQRKAIGRVDVLFIPVGGFVTIDARQAKMIVEELKPAVVFPMHYGDTRFYRLAAVSLFTSMFPPGQVRQLDDSEVRVRRADFTAPPVVYTLTPIPHNY